MTNRRRFVSLLPTPQEFREYSPPGLNLTQEGAETPPPPYDSHVDGSVYAQATESEEFDRATNTDVVASLTIAPTRLRARPYTEYHELVRTFWVPNVNRLLYDLETFVQAAHTDGEITYAAYSSALLSDGLRAAAADGSFTRFVYYAPNALATHAASVGFFAYPDLAEPNKRGPHDVRELTWRHYRPGVDLFFREQEDMVKAMLQGVYRRGDAFHEPLVRSIGQGRLAVIPPYWAKVRRDVSP